MECSARVSVAFAPVGLGNVERVRHDERQHRVSQELESLVALELAELVRVRGMPKRRCEQLAAGEAVSQQPRSMRSIRSASDGVCSAASDARGSGASRSRPALRRASRRRGPLRRDPRRRRPPPGPVRRRAPARRSRSRPRRPPAASTSADAACVGGAPARERGSARRARAGDPVHLLDPGPRAVEIRDVADHDAFASRHRGGRRRAGDPAAMPRPCRWPTVKRWMPRWRPSTRPASSTISPSPGSRLRPDALDDLRRSRRRARSRSPGSRACRRSRARAPARARGPRACSSRRAGNEPIASCCLARAGTGSSSDPSPRSTARKQARLPGLGIVRRCAHSDRSRRASAPKTPRALEQVVELEALVAGDAGNRRAPREIGVGEGLDHLAREALGVVRDVEADAEALGDPPRIVGVLERAAARAAARESRIVTPIASAARLDQQRRGDRGVDAARHRDDDPLALAVAASRLARAPRPRAPARGSNCEHAIDLRLVDAVPHREAQELARACSGERPIASSTFDGSIEPE